MDDSDDVDRKELRKTHLESKNRHKKFVDDETRFANKSKKVRKHRLQALEQEELEEEWEEYLR